MSKTLRYLPDGKDFSAGDFPSDFGKHIGRIPDNYDSRRPGDHAEPGFAKGGALRMDEQSTSDDMQDKRMIKSAVHQHENHEHDGEHTTIMLAKGGRAKKHHKKVKMPPQAMMAPQMPLPAPAQAMMPPGAMPPDQGAPMRRGGGVKGMRSRLPRSMRPKAATDHSSLNEHMPVNRAPKNPMKMRSEPNVMPGGQLGYGVQPGDEPTKPPANGGRMPLPKRRGGAV